MGCYTLIKNFNDIKALDLETGAQYLCIMECYDGVKMGWKPIIGDFYKKDDVVVFYDKFGNAVKRAKIPETGFYYISRLPGMERKILQLTEVRYYEEITIPKTDPDSFMQIEN